MKKKIAFICVLVLALQNISLAQKKKRQGPSKKNIEQRIKKKKKNKKQYFDLAEFLNDTLLTTAHVGVYVQDANSLHVIDEYASNKLFLPASCAKIATTYAALKNLEDSLVGLVYRNEDDSSITFKGTGDPTFLHKDFKVQSVYDFLKIQKKIKFVNDIKRFTGFGSGWSWNDYEESYMAERSELPMYGNVLTATKEDGKFKIIPNFFLRASYDSLLSRIVLRPIDNVVKHKKLGCNQFYFDRNDFNNKTQIEVPFTPSFSVVTQLLKDTLNNVDERVYSEFTSELPKPFDKKIYSQPTDSLLKPMMYNSDNFFAEQTLLMISYKKMGYMSDEDVIKNILNTDLCDLPQKPRWVDGSGLSRYNLFSPQDFVFILNKMNKEFSWQRVSNLFPTSGQGTLRNFYKNHVNQIFAKTGSMGNTFCIAGFLKTKAGKDFTFSIMINHYYNTPSNNIRLLVEKYLTNLIDNN